MELEKVENSDGGSEENDRADQDTAATTKRSYDCTFCKRGFTNAQALGGHMNIHRKDRAKGKQPSSSSVRNDDRLMVNREDHHMNPTYLRPIFPTQVPTKYYPVSKSQRINNNPKLPYGYVMNEELLGANLSLQTDPTVHADDRVRREINEQDEVDLELRLGHNP